YKRRVDSNSILVAGGSSKKSDADTRESKSLLAALFSRADEDEEGFEEAPATTAEKPAPKREKQEQPAEVLTASVEEDKIDAAVLPVRPALAEASQTLQTGRRSTRKTADGDAMKAASTPQAAEAENAAEAKEAEETSEFANLAAFKVPVPVLVGDR